MAYVDIYKAVRSIMRAGVGWIGLDLSQLSLLANNPDFQNAVAKLRRAIKSPVVDVTVVADGKRRQIAAYERRPSLAQPPDLHGWYSAAGGVAGDRARTVRDAGDRASAVRRPAIGQAPDHRSDAETIRGRRGSQISRGRGALAPAVGPGPISERHERADETDVGRELYPRGVPPARSRPIKYPH